MVNVVGPIGQADCHLLHLPDGRRVLIDAAEAGDAPGRAVTQLQRLKIDHLALVVISHFHADHYGRLLAVLDAGIKVDQVILNVPAKQVADREIPWGCNYEDVQAVLASLRSRGIPYTTPQAGDLLLEFTTHDGTKCGIEVLCAYDGVNTPIGETDVNDTSIILRVFFGQTRMLFTGDLNHALGAYLANSDMDLRAELLKVPHHGTEGTAPNEFFERVQASAVLVPAPTSLWMSQRSERIRKYFEDRNIPAYVSGQHGNVTVAITPQGFKVFTEL